MITLSIHNKPSLRDDRSVGDVEHRRRYGPNPDRFAHPMHVSRFYPRPDAECVYANANQVRRNKAKLSRAKADYANNHAVDN